jgi:hypothetical protein
VRSSVRLQECVPWAGDDWLLLLLRLLLTLLTRGRRRRRRRCRRENPSGRGWRVRQPRQRRSLLLEERVEEQWTR